MPSFLSRQVTYGRPAEAPYLDQPIEMMAAAERAPQQAKAIAQQSIGDVLNLKADKLQVHEGEYEAIKGDYIQRANELADELSKGVNQESIQKLKQLRRQADFDLSAEGRLGKMQSAYNQQKAWEKELDAEVAKYNESGGTKGISPDIAEKKFNMSQFNLENWYNSKGLTDKEVPLPKLVGTVDVEGLAYDLAQKLPKMKTDDYNRWAEQRGLGTINSQVFQQIKGEKESNIYSVDSKGNRFLDPNKIKTVVSSFLGADPKVQTYLQDEADVNIYDMISSDLSIAPKEAQDQVKAQYKQLYPQLQQSIVNKRIGDVAQRARDAFSTISETQTDKLHTATIPKWGFGLSQDSSGQAFTLPKEDTLGESADIKLLDGFSFDKSGNPVQKYDPLSASPTGLTIKKGLTESKENQQQRIKELQRKYPEIDAFSNNPKELVENIKKALRGDGTYNITIPEKLVVSKYFNAAINSLNPKIAGEDWKATEEKPSDEELEKLKKSSYTINPLQQSGVLKAEIGDKKYVMEIPENLKRNLQPTYDLYAAGQRAWQTGKPDFVSIAGAISTVKRGFNPQSKKYELTIYHPSVGTTNFESILTQTAERSLKSIENQAKVLDINVEDTQTEETEE